MSAYTCPHCGYEHAGNTLTCPNCGRLRLPANQLNLFVSLSVISVAMITALLYWGLSELIWLPLAQTGLGFAIEAFNLQNYVPYWTGLIERRAFFSATWLLFGAFLYIPVITVVAMRLGPRRAAVAALAGPAPFAVMDVWSWWVRAVSIPSDVDRASVLLPLPGLLQFLAVFAISAVVVLPVYFLFINLERFLPRKVTTAFLIQPINPAAVKTLPKPVVPSPALEPLELPKPIPQETASKSESQSTSAETGLDTASVSPAPAPEAARPAPITIVESRPPTEATEPGPVVSLPAVPESPPGGETVDFDAVSPVESAPRSGVPIWLIVVGLVGLAVTGAILIIFALRA